jgi:hypothetical protein
MLRRIGLGLVILVSVLVTLPLATSLAHNLRFQPATPSYRAHRSRAWWRRHRAKVRRRMAMIARRRALLAAQKAYANALTTTSLAKAYENAVLATQNSGANPLTTPSVVKAYENATLAAQQSSANPLTTPSVVKAYENALLAAQQSSANPLTTPSVVKAYENAVLAAQKSSANPLTTPSVVKAYENALLAAQKSSATPLTTPSVVKAYENALLAAQKSDIALTIPSAVKEYETVLLAAQKANAIPPTRASVVKASENHVALPSALSFPENFYRDGSLALPVPNGWVPAASSKGSSVFRIVAPNGMPAGNATLSVVAVTPANIRQPIGREQRKMLGGVHFTDLRRTVIDRMIGAGGWVVNDREREIGGHRVFHVVAQTPGSTPGAPDQIWNFYFTEMNGRVYSLTTRTAGGPGDTLSTDAEKFLSAFNPMTNAPAIKK